MNCRFELARKLLETAAGQGPGSSQRGPGVVRVVLEFTHLKSKKKVSTKCWTTIPMVPSLGAGVLILLLEVVPQRGEGGGGGDLPSGAGHHHPASFFFVHDKSEGLQPLVRIAITSLPPP